jgi:hypothetical protein
MKNESDGFYFYESFFFFFFGEGNGLAFFMVVQGWENGGRWSCRS